MRRAVEVQRVCEFGRLGSAGVWSNLVEGLTVGALMICSTITVISNPQNRIGNY